MTTLADVTAMLPLITPYSMPDDATEATLLYSIAEQKVVSDAIPTTDNILLTKAYCFYIAHLLSSKSKTDGVTSERLGQWSVTYAQSTSGTTHWMEEYTAIKTDLIRGTLISCPEAVKIDDIQVSYILPTDTARIIYDR